MYTSVTALTLASVLAGANIDAPKWHDDYAKAKAVAVSAEKPMAIFFAGSAGPKNVVKGGLNDEINQSLRQDFVCLFVNTDTERGKQLARQWEVNSTGLVISDRTTNLQAFWNNGRLSDDEVIKRLSRYAKPTHQVVHTERISEPVSTTGTSLAPTTVTPSHQPTYAPIYSPGWGSYGGSGLNCRH